nr:hypothetical protein [Luminiphilus sp.]
MSPTSQALDNPCDQGHVYIDGASLVIEASGFDDTDNIQCALDTAVEQGVTKIKLERGDFTVSSLYAEGFNGTVSGVSKANTLINIAPESVDCAAIEAEGRVPAAITFMEGAPRLQNMSILADSFCATEGERAAYVVKFTGGEADTGECSNDVIFGVIDRVALETVDSDLNGIVAAAEGIFFGGCKQSLLGTLKVNRSEFTGFRTAILTSMRSAAQVDINFNSFQLNIVDTDFFNSNQSTNIIGNAFEGGDFGESFYHAILIRTVDDSPKESKFVISANRFEIEGTADLFAAAIMLDQRQNAVNITPYIASNRFNLSSGNDSRVFGILESGFPGGVISGNSFSGSAEAGIYLGAYDSDNPSVNWVITANAGFGNFDAGTYDVYLGTLVSDSIVGPNQNIQFGDGGTNNTLIDPTSGTAGSGNDSGGSTGSGNDNTDDSGNGNTDNGGSSGNADYRVCATSTTEIFRASAATVVFKNGATTNNYNGRSWYTQDDYLLFKADNGRWYALYEPYDVYETPPYEVFRLDLINSPTSCFEPDLYQVTSTRVSGTTKDIYWDGGSTFVNRDCSITSEALLYIFTASEYQTDVLLDVRTGDTCETRLF